MDENKNKKRMILMLIGLFVSLLAVVGATYAYFSITGTNNSQSTVITNTFGESGNVTLTGSNTLHITLNATDMATNNKGNIYYATDVQSENYKTTSTSYEVAKAQVVGGDDSQSYSNCKFNLNVALSGDMANLLQEGDMKITFSGAYTGTYDLSNLSSPYEVTLSNLSGTNRTQSINAVVEFNNLDKDQVYLAGKTLTITLTNTDFSCNGTTQPAYTIASGDLDTVGSEVCIGSECFYVIGKEGNNIKLLAKWNLKVGNIVMYGEDQNCNGYSDIYSYKTTDINYGLQSNDENWQDYYDYGTTYCYPNIFRVVNYFSDLNYWSSITSNYPSYVYNHQSNLYGYVEDYVNYLNTQGVSVSGRLIKIEELTELGCNINSACSNAPSWIKNINYWTGSAADENKIYAKDNDWYYGTNGLYAVSEAAQAGVRPVIILEP